MEDKEQNEEKAKKIKVLMVNAERNYSQFEGNDADPFEETTFEENENVIYSREKFQKHKLKKIF